MSNLPLDEYRIGIVCALYIELAAVRSMFDEDHGRVDEKDILDHNTYHAGRIHKHSVIVACLPAGRDGVAAAATVAKDMLRTFRQMRFGLLVGIGGGIPNLKDNVDIRLGDVVVSKPEGPLGGVIQYDKGKTKTSSTWERKGALNAPPQTLLTALASLQAEHELLDSSIPLYLATMLDRWPKLRASGYDFPGIDKDHLGTGTGDIIERQPRCSTQPHIHYGTIASGNQVIRDVVARDSLRDHYGAICVEMEAAGLMNELPCLVIRGISDYADQHKNDIWHRYAAATAAAFAKELLLHVSVHQMDRERSFAQIVNSLEQIKDQVSRLQERTAHGDSQQERNKILDWIASDTYDQQYQDLRQRRCPGTGQWFLNNETYRQWESGCFPVLLCPGLPGAGKSIISSIVTERLLQQKTTQQQTLAYIFCNYNRQEQQSFKGIAKILLRQMLEQQKVLPKVVMSCYHTSQKNSQRPIMLHDVQELFLAVVSSSTRTFLIIDAFDECAEFTRRNLSNFLWSLLDTASIKEQAQLGVFITHRPGQDLQIFSDINRELVIQAERSDQVAYLTNRFPELSSRTDDQAIRSMILDRIASSADGIFLHTVFYFNSLLGKRTITDIKNELSHIERQSANSTSNVGLTYALVYDTAVQRIEQQGLDDSSWAQRLIAWAVCAARPLAIEEMTDALTEWPSSMPTHNAVFEESRPVLSEVVALCAGLVTINHRTGTTELAHYTIHEYFARLEHRPQWMDAALTSIALTCIGHINSDVSYYLNRPRSDAIAARTEKRSIHHSYQYDSLWRHSENGRHNDSSLHDYAVIHWGYHVSKAQTHIKERLINLLNDSDFARTAASLAYLAPQSWHSCYCGWLASKEWHGRQLAACFDLHHVITSIMPQTSATTRKSNSVLWDEAPLSIAVCKGYTSTVQRLLAEDHVKQPPPGLSYSPSASAAVRHGRLNLLHLISEHFTTCSCEPASVDSTAVWFAVQFDYQETIHFLRDSHGALAIAHPGKHLHAVAKAGLVDIVDLFLKNGAMIDSLDDSRDTALQAAAKMGQTGVVQLLISRGAEVNKNTLQAAAKMGQTGVVQLLINHGAEVNKKTVDGRTALWDAVFAGHAATVQVLLAHGASECPTWDVYLRELASAPIEPANLVDTFLKIPEAIQAVDDLCEGLRYYPVHQILIMAWTLHYLDQKLAQLMHIIDDTNFHLSEPTKLTAVALRYFITPATSDLDATMNSAASKLTNSKWAQILSVITQHYKPDIVSPRLMRFKFGLQWMYVYTKRPLGSPNLALRFNQDTKEGSHDSPPKDH